MRKNILILILTIMGLSSINAQDTYLQEESQSVEERAKVLTKKYEPELVMTTDQALLFEKKLGEFLIRSNEIKQLNRPVKEKLQLLQELSAQENSEMANILSRRQVRRYAKVKSKLQPIAMVVDSVENKK
ncbi:MAG: hypothetical protein WBG48_15350 [Pricia sp.]